jgi:sortase A
MEMEPKQQVGFSPRIEWALLALGLFLLAVWGAAWVHRTVLSRAALAKFETERSGARDKQGPPMRDPATGSAVDFTLWSEKRIEGFKASLAATTEAPLAVLRIPKIQLEVPIFDDTEEFTLNRGVGRIVGTAPIGQGGNLGVAGHRDGFFRGLKDVLEGDVIEVVGREKTDTYVIRRIQIVEPDDVSVLNATAKPTLTLVTCYPFYFVGSAPQRYIVTAEETNSSQADKGASEGSKPNGRKNSNEEKTK